MYNIFVVTVYYFVWAYTTQLERSKDQNVLVLLWSCILIMSYMLKQTKKLLSRTHMSLYTINI